ncbi:MAG: alkaline phosphatase family protein [Thaumarchaeota archaeon]|nr:alkaline phosphatase family protein [Nitrososphaerota archaeon]
MTLGSTGFAIPAIADVQTPDAHKDNSHVKHVLLISVDGLHQSGLDWYVSNHPNSELAKLVQGGAEFTNAHTSDPSDSDPGGTALMTGGDSRATGVYYNVEYNHNTYEAGTTSCHGPAGGDVVYDSPDDINDTRLDAGQNIPGLDSNPALVMDMTGTPQTLLVPSTFPVDPVTCQPIPPHSYLKVNTMFEVAKAAGLLTAWSDKHPVYESFNGPSGHGIDDFFAPEIDSNAVEPNGVPYPGGISWTGSNAATKQYDGYKVQAVLNEIDGYDHSGKNKVGVPAIFGMNFQTVSTAEAVIERPEICSVKCSLTNLADFQTVPIVQASATDTAGNYFDQISTDKPITMLDNSYRTMASPTPIVDPGTFSVNWLRSN